MKKQLIILAAVVVMTFGGVSIGNAVLINIGSGVLFDDTNNQYWMQDLNVFEWLSYDQQISQIQLLNSSGTVSGFANDFGLQWRMASLDDMIELWGYSADELVASFVPNSLITSSTSAYWDYKGRYDLALDSQAHYYTSLMDNLTFEFRHKGAINLWSVQDSLQSWGFGAWVTADSVLVSPVPEPGTLALLGSGLLGMGATRFRRKRTNA